MNWKATSKKVAFQHRGGLLKEYSFASQKYISTLKGVSRPRGTSSGDRLLSTLVVFFESRYSYSEKVYTRLGDCAINKCFNMVRSFKEQDLCLWGHVTCSLGPGVEMNYYYVAKCRKTFSWPRK